jgi:heme oxygenase
MHKALEEESFGNKIMSGQLTLADYKQIIRMNYEMNKAFEAQWNEITFELPNSLMIDQRSKMEALSRDMELLDLEKTETSLSFPADSYPQFIGSLYVFEGSTLGGAVILKQLVKNENLKQIEEFNFYNCYGDKIGMLWKLFLDHLTAITDENEVNECIAAANTTFSVLKDYMSSARTAS